MARAKNSSLAADLEAQVKAIRKRYRPLRTRYCVVEVTPAHDDDCRYIPEVRKIVSGYKETRADAEQWIELYDPDPGNHFEIAVETLCEHVERTWMPGDWFEV